MLAVESTIPSTTCRATIRSDMRRLLSTQDGYSGRRRRPALKEVAAARADTSARINITSPTPSGGPPLPLRDGLHIFGRSERGFVLDGRQVAGTSVRPVAVVPFAALGADLHGLAAVATGRPLGLDRLGRGPLQRDPDVGRLQLVHRDLAALTAVVAALLDSASHNDPRPALRRHLMNPKVRQRAMVLKRYTAIITAERPESNSAGQSRGRDSRHAQVDDLQQHPASQPSLHPIKV